MLKKCPQILIGLFTLCLLGAYPQEAQALEEITQAKVTKTVHKVEDYVQLADNVVILFDSSSSMGDTFDDSGKTKLQAAKEILQQRAAAFPDRFPKLNVGLYSYTPPSRILPNKTSLKGYQVFYKMQPFNKAEFLKAVDQIPDEASGPTLINNAMRRLNELLANLSGTTVVFLFTDGSHSEDANEDRPVELAKRLAQKYDVSFQLISTATIKTQIKLMEAVASINESSRVYPFELLMKHPERYTGAVFAIEESYVVSATARNEVVGFKLDHINFGFDQSTIEMEFTEELNAVGAILQEKPDSYIVLAGHTDNIGSEEYNLKLSHQRVEAVGAYLAEKFEIDPSRVVMFWYGEAAPVADNNTKEGRLQNRRVIGFISGVN